MRKIVLGIFFSLIAICSFAKEKNGSLGKDAKPTLAQYGQVIESRIDGIFDGWHGDTIVELENGQIWQQAEYFYSYTYEWHPKVIISQSSLGWVMKVKGTNKTVKVKRLK